MGMCFTLLVPHDMTKMNHTLETKRERFGLWLFGYGEHRGDEELVISGKHGWYPYRK